MRKDPRATHGFTEEEGQGSRGTSDYLFHLMSGDGLSLPLTRQLLDLAQLVVLGRGETQRVQLDREQGADRLTIEVTDHRVSRVHARLVRESNHWIIEDTGSRNGTLVNGKRVTRAVLADGDLVEVGSSFFLYRRALAIVAADITVPGIVTLSPSYLEVLAKLARVSESPAPILLLGESGTGKDVLAHAIHSLSRRKGDCVAVNCGALPETLVEPALFGHKKGAFTGAVDERPGFIQSANKGTLFLDEIADLPFTAQAALLRVLEDRQVIPVGGIRPIDVDFRLVAATNRPLAALCEEGRFREDLLARIAGFSCTVPPLRDRREDLGVLISTLLRESEDVRVRAAAFTNAALRTLFLSSWPRNVRELRQCLETATILAHPKPVDAHHLPATLTQGVPSARCAESVLSEADLARRQQLSSLLAEHQGNVSAVARAVGKDRKQVRRWMSRFGLCLIPPHD